MIFWGGNHGRAKSNQSVDDVPALLRGFFRKLLEVVPSAESALEQAHGVGSNEALNVDCAVLVANSWDPAILRGDRHVAHHVVSRSSFPVNGNRSRGSRWYGSVVMSPGHGPGVATQYEATAIGS